LNKIWDYISNTGTEDKATPEEKQLVRLSNQVSLIFALVAFPYFFIFRHANLFFSGNLVLFFVLWFSSGVIFNKFKFYYGSIFSTVLCGTVAISYYACILSKAASAQYILIPLLILPLVLIFTDNKTSLLGFSFIPISCSLLLEYYDYSFFPQLLFDSEVIKFISISAQVSTFIIVLMIFYYFYNTLFNKQKQLAISNRRLKKHYETLSRAFDRLRAQKLIEEDLEKGKKLQDSFLPQKPPLLGNVTISHAFEPAKKLSGDYFDYFYNDKPAISSSDVEDNTEDTPKEPQLILKQVGIVVADVVGKGVAASLEMFSVKTVFKLLHESWFQPKKLVTLINQMAADSHLFSKYVPLIYATLTQLDATKYKLTYVNAGHEYGVIIKAGSNTILLDQGGAPAGMDPNETYTETHFILEKGDTVFLFTDGCTDVKSPNEDCIGIDELIPILKEATQQDKKDISKYVRNRLKDFQGHAPQADDITIVAIHIG
jgi:serine phosphatase RsbU (regulator of sigma subunit)